MIPEDLIVDGLTEIDQEFARGHALDLYREFAGLLGELPQTRITRYHVAIHIAAYVLANRPPVIDRERFIDALLVEPPSEPVTAASGSGS